MNKDRNKRLDSLFGGGALAAITQDALARSQGLKPRVGAGAVGAAEVNLLRDENVRLREALAGAEVTEIDPALVDPSPYPDRLDLHEDTVAFRALVASIRERGQEIPVLLRPHPEVEGRYQTVYGHRRLRAITELGDRKARAVVRNLPDEDLLLAQGLENSARQDLSWIEKALFARTLEAFAIAQGRDGTSLVLEALSIHAPEASRYRTTIEAIPDEVVRAIGSAPRFGRTKWMALAESLRVDAGALARVRAALAGEDFAARPSDGRFAAVLAAALPSGNLPGREAEAVTNGDGAGLARVERRARSVRIDVENKEFAEFVVQRLAQLHADYQMAKSSTPGS